MHEIPTEYLQALERSLHYLNSQEAFDALQQDAYWPKWDSPWWHMLLLHEMGEARRLPESIVRAFVEALNRIPVSHPSILSPDGPKNAALDSSLPCHCQLGNVYRVLSSYGIDLDQELPWIKPSMLSFQMADGGLNCDINAYFVKNEVPSSMVATIAAFEAVLLQKHRPWTEEEKIFLERGAQFLIRRKLIMASESQHNAAERRSAEAWLKPCFPRFYFYDALRGLTALLRWSEAFPRPIPEESVRDVINYYESAYPDGRILIARQAFDGIPTRVRTKEGGWLRGQPASIPPLLESVSKIGEYSPFLTKEWGEARTKLFNRA